LLERPERRSAEGEQGKRAKIVRQRLDDAPTPAVERMVGAVARFGAIRECAPAFTARKAGENDGANVRKGAAPLFVGEKESAARNEARLRDGG
jgi:hypothetical protein